MNLAYDMALNAFLALYMFLGSISFGYLFLRTGYKRAFTISRELKLGWSLIFGTCFSIIAIIFAIGVDAANATTLGFAELLFIFSTMLFVVGIGIFYIKTILFSAQTTPHAFPQKQQQPVQPQRPAPAPEPLPQQQFTIPKRFETTLEERLPKKEEISLAFDQPNYELKEKFDEQGKKEEEILDRLSGLAAKQRGGSTGAQEEKQEQVWPEETEEEPPQKKWAVPLKEEKSEEILEQKMAWAKKEKLEEEKELAKETPKFAYEKTEEPDFEKEDRMKAQDVVALEKPKANLNDLLSQLKENAHSNEKEFFSEEKEPKRKEESTSEEEPTRSFKKFSQQNKDEEISKALKNFSEKAGKEKKAAPAKHSAKKENETPLQKLLREKREKQSKGK